MKTILNLLFISMLFASCKKSDTKPDEKLVIECYSKHNSATLNFAGNLTNIDNHIITKEYTVNDSQSQFIVSLKNINRFVDDSLNLKVTYKGITKQIGEKTYNNYINLQFQLSQF